MTKKLFPGWENDKTGMKEKIFIFAATVFIAVGCGQKKNEGQFGPEETLKAFYKSMCAGDFCEAKNLCDTLNMGEYLRGFRTLWEKSESSVSEIASDILSEIGIETTDIKKSGDRRTVFYKLSATVGPDKEKVAILRKEEGGWKIETITDRI